MILGWRSWKLRNGKLDAFFKNYTWQPGTNTAACKYVWLIGDMRGVVPHEDHDCGIYGSHTYERLVAENYVNRHRGRIQPIYDEPNRVVGIARAWGETFIHTHCWRSEHAAIVGLLYEGDNIDEFSALSRYYNVPIFSKREELEHHALHFGRFVSKPQILLDSGIVPEPCLPEDVEIQAYGQPLQVALQNQSLPYLTEESGLQVVSTTCLHGERYTELVVWKDFKDNTDEVVKYVKHMHNKHCENARGYDLWQLRQFKKGLL